MKRDSWTVSDLHLEQFVLGELTVREERRVRDALRTDESLRARLAEIERSNTKILGEYPPERMAPLIQERRGVMEPRPRRVPPYVMFVLPAAAVVVLFLSIFTPVYLSRLAGANGTDVTRVKGDTHLSIFKKTSAGAEELTDGSAVRPKDVLQISYVGGEARYGVIFSVDGRGIVTFHLPENFRGQAVNSPELERQGQTVLPFAYELDDAPGFERFFFVFAKSPFDVREIATSAKALSSKPQTADKAGLRLPKGLTAFSLLLKKQG
jgi:hypothetical protein